MHLHNFRSDMPNFYVIIGREADIVFKRMYRVTEMIVKATDKAAGDFPMVYVTLFAGNVVSLLTSEMPFLFSETVNTGLPVKELFT